MDGTNNCTFCKAPRCTPNQNRQVGEQKGHNHGKMVQIAKACRNKQYIPNFHKPAQEQYKNTKRCIYS